VQTPLVTMSQKELDRIPVLQQLCDKRLMQSRAAKLLNLSVRQVQRLLNLYQIEGAAGLSSRKRDQAFDKLSCVDQGAIVDNKRLGAVLRLAQVHQDEREQDGKRERSKKMPKRRAQARVQEQLKAINPVLANPAEFRASLKR
jgi:hypothetical protein